MELRISSVCWFFWASTGGSLPLGGEGTGPPLPVAATVAFCPDLGVRACQCVSVSVRVCMYAGVCVCVRERVGEWWYH